MSVLSNLLLLLLLNCCLSVGSNTRNAQDRIPLYIGGFFPKMPNVGSVPGDALEAAAQMALEHVNNSDILPGYELKMIVKDSKCDPAYAANSFMEFIMEKPTKLVMFGAACSKVTELLAELSGLRNIIQLSYASRSRILSNRDRFPTLFRSIPSETARNLGRVDWIQHYQWKRVGTIYADRQKTSNDQVIDKLKRNNATIVFSEHVTSQTDLNVIMQTIKRTDARIIIGTFYETLARKIFCEAFRSGTSGSRYVWILIGTYISNWWSIPDPQINCSVNEMRQAVAYTVIFNNKISLKDAGNDVTSVSGLTPVEYYSQYMTRLHQMNITRTSNITAFAYDGIWIIAMALNQSIAVLKQHGLSLEEFTYHHTNTTQILLSVIEQLDFQGVTGGISFFGEGDRFGMVEILQQDENGNAVTIGCYDVRTGTLDLAGNGNVWPGGRVPQDKTLRIRQLMTIPVWVYVLIATITSVCFALAFVFLVFNVIYRKKRYIKLSSPNLNNVMIGGSMLIYVSVFISGLDGRLTNKQFEYVCRTRYCLLSLGFTIAFGALFTKTWRVHKIFTHLKHKVIKDIELFKMLGVLVLIDSTLLALWMGIDPPEGIVIVFEDQAKLSYDGDQAIIPARQQCTNSNLTVWTIVIYAFHTLFLALGLFLAWETRQVSIPALNDSRFIGISVYNVVLLCAVGVPMAIIPDGKPEVSFGMLSAVILFCTTMTLCILFIPKVIQMYKDPDGNPIQRISTHGTSFGNRSENRISTDKQIQLVAENSRLKQELEQIRGDLRSAEEKRVRETKSIARQFTDSIPRHHSFSSGFDTPTFHETTATPSLIRKFGSSPSFLRKCVSSPSPKSLGRREFILEGESAGKHSERTEKSENDLLINNKASTEDTQGSQTDEKTNFKTYYANSPLSVNEITIEAVIDNNKQPKFVTRKKTLENCTENGTLNNFV